MPNAQGIGGIIETVAVNNIIEEAVKNNWTYKDLIINASRRGFVNSPEIINYAEQLQKNEAIDQKNKRTRDVSNIVGRSSLPEFSQLGGAKQLEVEDKSGLGLRTAPMGGKMAVAGTMPTSQSQLMGRVASQPEPKGGPITASEVKSTLDYQSLPGLQEQREERISSSAELKRQLDEEKEREKERKEAEKKRVAQEKEKKQAEIKITERRISNMEKKKKSLERQISNLEKQISSAKEEYRPTDDIEKQLDTTKNQLKNVEEGIEFGEKVLHDQVLGDSAPQTATQTGGRVDNSGVDRAEIERGMQILRNKGIPEDQIQAWARSKGYNF